MKKILTVLFSASVLLVFCSTAYCIFYVTELAPKKSHGFMITLSAYAGCKSKDLLVELASPKGVYENLFSTLTVASQRIYEINISKQASAADGGGLIADAFQGYGQFGEVCDQEIIKFSNMYLTRGGDINKESVETGKPALFFAVASTNPDGLDFLVSHGANVCVTFTNSKGISRNIRELSEGRSKQLGNDYNAMLAKVTALYDERCSKSQAHNES